MKTTAILILTLTLSAILAISIWWHHHEQDDGSERFHGPSTWSEGPR